MPQVYKEQMIDILTQLGITIPANLSMNQRQIERLVVAIEAALDSYDPLPTGDAVAGDVLATKTFSNATGTGKTGTMPNNGAAALVISAVAEAPVIAAGYHNGSGTATIAAEEAAKIIAENIKSGVTILGVLGTYTGT